MVSVFIIYYFVIVDQFILLPVCTSWMWTTHWKIWNPMILILSMNSNVGSRNNSTEVCSYAFSNFNAFHWEIITNVECFSAKETFMLNLIYDYHLATESLRAVDVIVSIKEPHDKYFFDRLVVFHYYRPILNTSSSSGWCTCYEQVVRRCQKQ